MGNTERELELQELARGVLNKIEPTVMGNLRHLKTSMELCYYLKQISNRLEILASLKYGIEGTHNDSD